MRMHDCDLADSNSDRTKNRANTRSLNPKRRIRLLDPTVQFPAGIGPHGFNAKKSAYVPFLWDTHIKGTCIDFFCTEPVRQFISPRFCLSPSLFIDWNNNTILYVSR